MKKIASVMLSVLMVFSFLVPMSASAGTGDYLYLEDDFSTIKGVKSVTPADGFAGNNQHAIALTKTNAFNHDFSSDAIVGDYLKISVPNTYGYKGNLNLERAKLNRPVH